MKLNLLYALRNILKNKINTTITVLGLSVAIACSLLIYIFVVQEYNYNNFHQNGNKIYRINYSAKYFNGEDKDVRVEPELIDFLKDEVPQIELSAEYRFSFQQELKYNESFFYVDMASASEDFFHMFSYSFLTTKPNDIFVNPNEIILTQTLADKLLVNKGDYNSLVGNVIEFPLAYGDVQFKILAVIHDIPNNSSINFDAVVSGESGNNFGGCDNGFGYTTVYYQVKEKANAFDTEQNVIAQVNTYYADRVKTMQDRNQLVNSADAFVPFILPLNKVYTYDEIFSCSESTASKSNFIILFTIAILILIIACSNYTILSLGQYMKKIGDVGVRKAMGANSTNIFYIFFSEGFIITLSSFVIGGLLCIAFVPLFEKLAEAQIYSELINSTKLVVFLVLLFFSIVLLTSVIPVFVFSKVSPNQMASKKLTIGNKSKLSQLFVSIQYSLSIILIIVTIFIIRQSNFLKNKPLGFESKNIINIHSDRLNSDQLLLFEAKLREHTGILNLTKTSRNFINGSSNSFVDRGDGEQVSVYRFKVDEHYVSTLKLDLSSGRDFTATNINRTDRTMIVNERFVDLMGIDNNPIGKEYNIMGMNFSIIGVVKDYHFSDMRRRIQPMMMFTRQNYGNGYYNILLRYHPQQVNEVVQHIEDCFKAVAPGREIAYNFWDETLKDRYQEQERWSKIIGYASVIAIIISSLGLFGLTILLINQRVKEIGVRKVNGAKSSEVLYTINKSFIAWLIASLIVACPVAYYLVNIWLQTFPFKVDISWWVFIASGFIALTVAACTVSWQSWRAANRNPVEALRYE